MNVFVSWSGERSNAFAKALINWLRTVHHYLRPWMSDEDLRKGDRWVITLSEKLNECNIGIICITPENMDSPWLHFEAGALSKSLGHARVCPILLGMLPKDLSGPLAQFQSTPFSKRDMYKLLVSLNEALGKDKLEQDVLKITFEKFWPDFESEISKSAKIGIPSSSLRSVVESLQTKGFPKPQIGRVASFNEGFESHLLYDVAITEAKERLYIFGRKNRKLFDKEHWDGIEELSKKIKNGFDFKCLFLSPNANKHILLEEHEDSDFHFQLKSCIENAVNVMMKFHINPAEVCRIYDHHRNHALVIIDNVVLFTPIDRDAHGRTLRLTKRQFEVIDVNLPLGKELLAIFNSTWKGAIPFSNK